MLFWCSYFMMSCIEKMTNKFWEANEHAKLIGTIISGDSYIGWYHSTVVEEKSPFDLPLLLQWRLHHTLRELTPQVVKTQGDFLLFSLHEWFSLLISGRWISSTTDPPHSLQRFPRRRFIGVSRSIQEKVHTSSANKYVKIEFNKHMWSIVKSNIYIYIYISSTPRGVNASLPWLFEKKTYKSTVERILFDVKLLQLWHPTQHSTAGTLRIRAPWKRKGSSEPTIHFQFLC